MGTLGVDIALAGAKHHSVRSVMLWQDKIGSGCHHRWPINNIILKKSVALGFDTMTATEMQLITAFSPVNSPFSGFRNG